MLSDDIIQTLKSYTANMEKRVTFVLERGDHANRAELVQFLNEIAKVSDMITVEQRDHVPNLRSPLSFLIEAQDEDTGIRFSGIPSGHEFNSLILALLQSGGSEIKLDEGIQLTVSKIQEPLHFEVFVSLGCHNCPEVVQLLNQLALLNQNVTSEMIDGGLFQDIITEREIQGVPSVYLNGEPFIEGRVIASDLINKLMHRAPKKSLEKNNSSLPLQDVVVVGGGPAGVSAAIYSARKGLAVTIIADRIGGQVKDTMGIENLISVPHTTGPELTDNLLAHLKDYAITVKEHLNVTHIDPGDIKTITLISGEIILSKTIIIATGAKWRELGVPGEKALLGKGVAYCPHCDGPFFKDKDVAVIGGGNSGMEAALDLAGIVKSVTVLEFMSELKADKVLVDQAKKRSNINFITGAATKSIVSDGSKVKGIEYIDRDTDQQHQISLAGVFVQIGLIPNSDFLGDLVEKTGYGEIIINDKCETSQAGIYACGDVTTVPYKQIVISMGEGAKASLACYEYLLTNSDQLDALYRLNETHEDKKPPASSYHHDDHEQSAA